MCAMCATARLRKGGGPRKYKALSDDGGCALSQGPVHRKNAVGLGCEIRQVRVNYDRNYDNYDRCELRRRNYDAPVITLRRSLRLAVGFMKQ